ncbi:uncharacterized protein BDV14DRAFT_205046 [Aspergillus stella-maris]|uniref:uncharacterized protein n=1 Tax=Aspergillus stella-maris TaxID=1810926 RepID=UPI003CCD67BF
MKIITLLALLLPAALAAPTLETRVAEKDMIWMTYYDTDNCKPSNKPHKGGVVEGVHPGHKNFGQNCVTADHVGRSFRLSKPLRDNIQLDFSVAKDTGSKDYKDKKKFCSIWKKSFFAKDDFSGCVNVGDFTCFKAWENKGLSKKKGGH